VPPLETFVSLANDALLHQRWDSPRSESVKGITDDGLALWPNEPQLLRIRALACTDILKTANVRREEGNVGEAVHLSKLAYQLDPSDVQAQRLAAEMETQAQAPPTDVVPPLANFAPPPLALPSSRQPRPPAPRTGPPAIDGPAAVALPPPPTTAAPPLAKVPLPAPAGTAERPQVLTPVTVPAASAKWL
jgi:hypothetical protein